MAVEVTNTSSSRPTTVFSPDTRFAIAPLNYKYRDYAINGEQLQDKATGEIFIKRPTDGKVVSYFQNKRYLYEQANELNLVLSTNTDYAYDNTNKQGMYAFVDYDIVTVQQEVPKNILLTNLVFGDTERYSIRFNLSIATNKFICRLTTRDTDKGAVEYLSSLYDDVLENYNGENVVLEAEARMYNTYADWIYDNVLVNFEVSVTKGNLKRTYTLTDAARLNEASCLDIGKVQIDSDFPTGYDTISVNLTSVEYRKIQFVMQHLELFGDPTTIRAMLREMMYPDGELYVYNCGIGCFTDNIADVNLNPVNGTLICVMDTVFTMRYISKMRSSSNGGGTLLRIDEPAATDWFVGSVWAEFCRQVDKDGVVTIHDTNLTIQDLERYYSKDTRVIVSLTLDASNTEDILVEILNPPNPSPDPEPEPDPDTEPDDNPDTNPDTDTESDTNTDTDSDTETDPEPETPVDTTDDNSEDTSEPNVENDDTSNTDDDSSTTGDEPEEP